MTHAIITFVLPMIITRIIIIIILIIIRKLTCCAWSSAAPLSSNQTFLSLDTSSFSRWSKASWCHQHCGNPLYHYLTYHQHRGNHYNPQGYDSVFSATRCKKLRWEEMSTSGWGVGVLTEDTRVHSLISLLSNNITSDGHSDPFLWIQGHQSNQLLPSLKAKKARLQRLKPTIKKTIHFKII